jgi:hypothetical protein
MASNREVFAGAGRLKFLDVDVQQGEESSDSSARTTVRARRPSRKALREEMALPWGVMGPLDLAPLMREASICLGDRIALLL